MRAPSGLRGARGVSAGFFADRASGPAGAGALPERRRPAARRASRARAAAGRPEGGLPRARGARSRTRRATGPVIRESADRALADGVDREAVLAFVESVRPQLDAPEDRAARGLELLDQGPAAARVPRARAGQSGADGLLVHGMPPRLRPPYYEAAADVGQPIVTTCYSSSRAGRASKRRPTTARPTSTSSSAYGSSGTVGPPDHSALAPVLETLRARTDIPIAVGFGVKTRERHRGARSRRRRRGDRGQRLCRLRRGRARQRTRRRRRLPGPARRAGGGSPADGCGTAAVTNQRSKEVAMLIRKLRRREDGRVGQRPQPPVPARGGRHGLHRHRHDRQAPAPSR